MDKRFEVIKAEIEKLDLQEPFSKWWGTLISILGPTVGIVLIIIGAIGGTESANAGWYVMLAFGAAILLISIAVGVVFSRRYFKGVGENIKKIKPIWESLHHLYFDNTPQFFVGEYELLFNGFTDKSAYSGTRALSFVLNGEEVIFSISEDREMRTRTVSDGKTTTTETYYVYFLKYNLKSQAEKLAGFDPISMRSGSIKRSKDGIFSSESILFNKKYIVAGQNQLQIYKLFTPRVIDAYNDYNLGGDVIVIDDGLALVRYRSTAETEIPYHPEIDNLGPISWKKDVVINSLYNKIVKNFTRYTDAQKDLFPLRIYEK